MCGYIAYHRRKRAAMRWVLLLLAFGCMRADGQQTDAVFLVPNASIAMTSSTLRSPHVPSYQQLNIVPQSGIVIQVDACQAGAFSASDASTCTACLPGTYSGTVTATAIGTCSPCESGKYSTTAAATSVSTCLDCRNGTYYTGIAAPSPTNCLPCPANSSSPEGSKLIQACVCDPGYQGFNGGACSPCNTSQWCLFGRANPCPLNSRSKPISSSLAQCLCEPGFFGDTTMGGPELTLCQVRAHTRDCLRVAIHSPRRSRERPFRWARSAASLVGPVWHRQASQVVQLSHHEPHVQAKGTAFDVEPEVIPDHEHG